mgnify:CR=1 FL=1
MGDGALKLLLDTHAWIWAFEGSSSLGAETARLLVDPRHERFVSTVSTLEIARLVARERLTLGVPLETWLHTSLRDLHLQTLPVDHAIARHAYALPEPFHPDPADRQLAATARLHACTLLTADTRLLAYPHLPTLDARK